MAPRKKSSTAKPADKVKSLTKPKRSRDEEPEVGAHRPRGRRRQKLDDDDGNGDQGQYKPADEPLKPKTRQKGGAKPRMQPQEWPIRETRSKPFAAPLDFLTPSPWRLPTEDNRIVNFYPNIVARDALETTVILHPRLPHLITTFLGFKQAHGSAIEKDLYMDMSQHDLVARMVEKRPQKIGARDL